MILNDQCSWLEDKLQRQYNKKSGMTPCKTILPILLWENMRIFFYINFTGNYTHLQFYLQKWSLLTSDLWLQKMWWKKSQSPWRKDIFFWAQIGLSTFKENLDLLVQTQGKNTTIWKITSLFRRNLVEIAWGILLEKVSAGVWRDFHTILARGRLSPCW